MQDLPTEIELLWVKTFSADYWIYIFVHYTIPKLNIPAQCPTLLALKN